MNLDKIVFVKRNTELEELLIRHSTTSQARFYLEKAGHSFDSYSTAHHSYKKALKRTIDYVPGNLRKQIIDKSQLSTFQFGNKDLIIVIGDDGLFVNVAKYIGQQPVISVNPDEERFDGVLASCTVNSFPQIFNNTIEGKSQLQHLTMAEAKLDDGQIIRALNDLFIGRKTHVSARYEISQGNKQEKQSSSGIIVSTGTGSTGWMTSLATTSRTNLNVPFTKDSDYLLFAVREPFPSRITGTTITYGKVGKNLPLVIKSNMPEDGVIFGDGVEKDYLEFNSGRTATIQPSQNKVYLVR